MWVGVNRHTHMCDTPKLLSRGSQPGRVFMVQELSQARRKVAWSARPPTSM